SVCNTFRSRWSWLPAYASRAAASARRVRQQLPYGDRIAPLDGIGELGSLRVAFARHAKCCEASSSTRQRRVVHEINRFEPVYTTELSQARKRLAFALRPQGAMQPCAYELLRVEQRPFEVHLVESREHLG